MSDSNKKKIKNPTIAIVDYGVGNLYSLKKACLKFADKIEITDDPIVIEKADAVILPGVGSFQAGMDGLKKRGLIGAVKKIAASGKPVLGICLGAQLMLERGYEFGEFKGLGIIPGKVVIFTKLNNAKIPQIGWNKVKFSSNKNLFKSLKQNPYLYFVHSYILKPSERNSVLAETKYGNLTFCSAIKKGNIYGTQFHPEKSGEVGLKIISNFIKLAS